MPPEMLSFPHVTGLNAQRLIELIALRVAPALAAGLVILSRQHVLLEGLYGVIGILIASSLVRRPRYPMHLMPFSSAIQNILVPPLGMALTAVMGAADGNSATEFTAGILVPPMLGALTIIVVGVWVTHVFRGDRTVSIAVIGSPGFTQVLSTELDAVGVRGYRVVGHIEVSEDRDGAADGCLGKLTDLRSVVLRHGIELLVLGPLAPANGAKSKPAEADKRFIASGASRIDVFETVADACLDLPVSMIDSSQLYEELFGHVPLGTTNSAWFAYLLHPRYRAGWPISKRLLDLVVGGLASLIALPLIAVSALAVKLGDGGPVFHRQCRIGERGREVEVVKLRTMRPDADNGEARWAGSDDDRVTPVGAILRRLHIDELPQLWLVLKGEMSLVGPRPEQPTIVGELEAAFSYYDRRHLVKPGITGWAQVRCGYAGSHIGTAWKLCHDLYYLKHRSFVFDLLIMIETVARVFIPEPIARPDQRLIVAMRAGGDVPSKIAAG